MSAKPKDDDLDFEDDEVLLGKDDEVDLVIDDDTPEEDRNRPLAGDDTADDDEDADMAQYSAAARSRIKVLTAKRHDERRAKEGAARERDAAVGYARLAQQENEALKARLVAASTGVVTATKSQAEAEIAQVKADLKIASELGDGEKVSELTSKLVNAQLLLNGARVAETQLKTQAAAPRQQPQLVQQPQISESQRSWGGKNSWFGRNRKMTAYAMGVHEELIERGVAPESEIYYNGIDKEMRKHFPDEFKSSQSSKIDPPIAGVDRRSPVTRGSNGKLTVRLNKSELSVARQLGVDPKKYARQKALRELSNG